MLESEIMDRFSVVFILLKFGLLHANVHFTSTADILLVIFCITELTQ